MMMKLKVLVLYGGNGWEREVSLSSGKEISRNLNKEYYEVEGMDLNDGLEKVVENKPELVFLALHGEVGEDGTVQAFLDKAGIKYTGCGAEASALGMDKLKFRKKMEELGILMPRLVDKAPCVVKPVDRGSSVGVSLVREEKDLARAIAKAKKVSDNVMIEELIEGLELTCGILGNEAMPAVEICPKNEFFDYEAKYTVGKCEEIVPARISQEVTTRVQETSLKVFKAIGGRGYGRVDFMVDKKGSLYVLEINTLPGMTPNSLLPKEAGAMGVSYGELLDRMIGLALL